MDLYAIDDVSDAAAATRAFLLPVDLGRWLRLSVVAFFVAGGAGLQAPVNVGYSRAPPAEPGLETLPEQVGGLLPGDPLAVAAALAVAALLFAVAFALVSSITEFVLVESLRSDSVRVRRYGRRYLVPGVRLFAFRLVVIAAAALFVGGVVYAAAPDGPLTTFALMWLYVVLVIAVLVVLPVVALVSGFTTDFVVPVMLLEGRSVLGGWRRFWSVVRARPVQYAAYAGAAALLTLVENAVGATLAGLGAAALSVPFLAVGSAVFVAAETTLSPVVLVVLGLLAAVYVALAAALFALVQVPLQVFLRYYALFVPGDTDPALDVIPDQRAAVRA